MRAEHRNFILEAYYALLRAFGPQHWWPADTPFEVAVGAILTQSVSWRNVEKAMAALKAEGLMDAASLCRCEEERLAQLIFPTGYYNAKARKLRAFTCFLQERFGGRMDALWTMPQDRLRDTLLGVHGIGFETADAILCYAGDLPAFVADAYSRRILRRWGLLHGDSYEDARRLVEGLLPPDPYLFNEFHALLVRLAKVHCLKSAPRCMGCPVRGCPRIGLEKSGEAIPGPKGVDNRGQATEETQEARAARRPQGGDS
ncbi:MAG: endonuclease III domain-containing protein [Bacillota bacterium]|jgi:endonuclease-3 related protein